MALGDATGQRAGILRLERHDPVVDVGQDLARSELERLARIEGDDVTDVLRHNEGVGRGLRRSRRGGQREETEQGDERARESVPGHAYRMYRNASALLLIDRTDAHESFEAELLRVYPDRHPVIPCRVDGRGRVGAHFHHPAVALPTLSQLSAAHQRLSGAWSRHNRRYQPAFAARLAALAPRSEPLPDLPAAAQAARQPPAPTRQGPPAPPLRPPAQFPAGRLPAGVHIPARAARRISSGPHRDGCHCAQSCDEASGAAAGTGGRTGCWRRGDDWFGKSEADAVAVVVVAGCDARRRCRVGASHGEGGDRRVGGPR